MRDPQLSAVIRYMQRVWPGEVPTDLQPYHQRNVELSIEAGCLFWGTRIVVPPKLRSQVLAELHDSHQGIVRMKGLARAHVWWPGLSSDIEKTVYNCVACQGNCKQPPTVPLHPLFLKRKLRTRLDLLKPSIKEHVHEKQMEQKKYHDTHSHHRSYSVGQSVLVRNLRAGPNWLVGVVTTKLGPVNYKVEVNGEVWNRHADQLMSYKGQQIVQ